MPETGERVEQLQPGAFDAPVADLAPLHPSDLLGRLQLQLEQLAPGNREQVDSLTAALAALAAAPSRGAADLLLRLLEERKLEGLEDSRGTTARAAAVEALLGMGYPFALELNPEDLEHLRAQSRGVSPYLRISGVCLVLALSGLQVVAAVVEQDTVSLLHAAVTVASVLPVAFATLSSRLRRLALGILVTAGLSGVGLSLGGMQADGSDTPVSLLSGLAALIAAAMMSRKR